MPVVSDTFSSPDFSKTLLEKKKEKIFHIGREVHVFVTRTKLTGTKALNVLIAAKSFVLNLLILLRDENNLILL